VSPEHWGHPGMAFQVWLCIDRFWEHPPRWGYWGRLFLSWCLYGHGPDGWKALCPLGVWVGLNPAEESWY
jgi:hypothetical protein